MFSNIEKKKKIIMAYIETALDEIIEQHKLSPLCDNNLISQCDTFSVILQANFTENKDFVITACPTIQVGDKIVK